MKIAILLATVVTAITAGSAIAEPAPGSHDRGIYCATRQAGNPYSKYCDYMAWSSWRRRGSWDASLDNACLLDPSYKPPGCWP
jgi:hypothetical protein